MLKLLLDIMVKHCHSSNALYAYLYLGCTLTFTAYILQNLGVKPNINKDNIFSSETDPSYTGPELPSRYDGIILPGDWYIPGKGRRKKRQHRASHGKIRLVKLMSSYKIFNVVLPLGII